MKKKYWWEETSPNAEVLEELAKLLREIRHLLIMFRRWYFDIPKDKVERWIKRIQRGVYVWAPIFLVYWKIIGRW